MNDVKVIMASGVGIAGDLVMHFELGSKILISILTIIYLILRIKDLRTKPKSE